MIRTYEEFLDDLNALLVIRSRNFVNTDCDLNALIQLVYNDINEHCVLGWEKYEVTIDDITDIVTAPANNEENNDVLTITKYYGSITAITDKNGTDVTKIFKKISKYEYQFINETLWEEFYDDTIHLYMSIHTSLETLNPKVYHNILMAMLEGVMYHIQRAIPNPDDLYAVDNAYKVYTREKDKLLDNKPQYYTVDKNALIGDREWL